MRQGVPWLAKGLDPNNGGCRSASGKLPVAKADRRRSETGPNGNPGNSNQRPGRDQSARRPCAASVTHRGRPNRLGRSFAPRFFWTRRNDAEMNLTPPWSNSTGRGTGAGDVTRIVLRDALATVAVGLVLGVPMAIWGRYLPVRLVQDITMRGTARVGRRGDYGRGARGGACPGPARCPRGSDGSLAAGVVWFASASQAMAAAHPASTSLGSDSPDRRARTRSRATRATPPRLWRRASGATVRHQEHHAVRR